MSSTAPLQPEPQPIAACTISRDVQQFDLLIEDMEAAMGENWGDLGFADALAFLEQPEAAELEFVAVALSKEDERQLPLIADIIAHAKRRGIKVVLIADDVSPAALHQLLREGGDEFVPYPLPEGELAQAIERLRSGAGPLLPEAEPTEPRATNDRSGVVIPVQGLAGGSGATTLAVNLAWELANIDRKAPPRVCLIDLDLQFGTTATYLDLPRREAVLEILSDTAGADSESLLAAMMVHQERLHVLTSPAELVPLDLMGPADVARLIEMARVNFDYVVIDMPSSVVDWSETVLQAAHVYFATLELDMRSAQNTMRLKRALQSEELPFEKLRFVLNRAPGFTDLSGKSRAKRLADSLGISIEVQLPDGGRAVTQSADHGTPLAEGAAKNPLRREIAKLARSVHKVNVAEAKA
ncbi:pilus assembly protein CpaE [Limimaricola soesokkakensis]|uniref:Pilus assembly protein CpaE n=1 Tax=Limimaricola soesokkakensis TaxID=1343159 RepID=A0A1X6YC56_9RHOB|nr:AAA family ATPase [Limimaricola soesokkakensis]PSK87076.1 pilus assembly protein CpaE [Limimaricola soesokkakensis]SLN17080.1 Sporulation initiation inhibitor protein Soj [Limimaricola soesokkakensis]